MRNPDNFDAFYADSARRVTSYLQVMTGSRAEAEDVVQEAYARAWQHWGRVSGYSDPEGWVRSVAYRIGVSSWRKSVSRRVAHRRHGPAMDSPGVSPDYVAVIAALRKISAGQRQAIVLYHLAGLSVGEVALETGVSQGTVKARLARGRRALAPHLSETAAGLRRRDEEEPCDV
jgi:RNA polymerase sigma-70 factor (ECF subfamily)